MALETRDKFENLGKGEQLRIPLEEAIAMFANDQFRGTTQLPPNFEGFVRKHADTHTIWFEGFLVIEKK